MNTEQKSFIKFVYKYENDNKKGENFPATTIEYTIDSESTINDCVKAFENFLLGCGYKLPENCSIEVTES